MLNCIAPISLLNNCTAYFLRLSISISLVFYFFPISFYKFHKIDSSQRKYVKQNSPLNNSELVNITFFKVLEVKPIFKHEKFVKPGAMLIKFVQMFVEFKKQ
jgi:hypothetical protein